MQYIKIVKNLLLGIAENDRGLIYRDTIDGIECTVNDCDVTPEEMKLANKILNFIDKQEGKIK